MLPLHIVPNSGAEIAITLGVGFFFGFVLERAGFGNAKNLAAQFYLHDMRVLKVMFTGIVTAMLLLFACIVLGVVDYTRIWVPPTHWGPAVVGGFVLGLGFILGGYCPGTSVVSAASGKIDGMFFVGGVVLGTFAFSVGSPLYQDFYQGGGYFGRLTLMDLSGLDAGLLVVGVFAMAIGAFVFAEFVERRFRRVNDPAPVDTRPLRMFRRSAVVAGGLVALCIALIGQPSAERLAAWKQEALESRVQSREIFVDPAELLGLMHNYQVPRILLDVREETDFNQFHLRGAQRITLDQLRQSWIASIPESAVVVVMGNGEATATEVWKLLAAHDNVNAYVLAGGVNRWLDIYADGRSDAPPSDVPAVEDGGLQHSFDSVLGSRLAFARPDPRTLPKDLRERPYEAKIKLRTAVRKGGGGCG
jgi:rhodanese-related sulfurtransferase